LRGLALLNRFFHSGSIILKTQIEGGWSMKKQIIYSVALMLTFGFAAFGICGSEANGPGVVVYEAKNGNVTFDHAGHAEALECAKCHAEDPPEAIEITRETAHAAACKDCHEQMQAGPVKCAECHIR
jgi:hypothetical protein